MNRPTKDAKEAAFLAVFWHGALWYIEMTCGLPFLQLISTNCSFGSRGLKHLYIAWHISLLPVASLINEQEMNEGF